MELTSEPMDALGRGCDLAGCDKGAHTCPSAHNVSHLNLLVALHDPLNHPAPPLGKAPGVGGAPHQAPKPVLPPAHASPQHLLHLVDWLKRRRRGEGEA
eukprot:CAMPEP_0114139320 /NCGR_PEP_ID=MMETSP0043_2-20121206/16791_1 /TAXON_ID=464988 /ORGANISM="Hemiselmis andersenii, Strain CCMP644" /LENGTH=98 /DNA_ID=CAMNT_0001233345 /DNA_START=585 /DNA_END=882 /DNA_ORIENTATION=-